MNREIKFRAWNGEMMSESFSPYEIIRDGQGLIDKNGVSVWWEGCEFEWLQYTGLKDKNGVDIYEGDIDHLGWVICFECGVFCIKQSPTSRTFISLHEIEISEIIGNIYQNPDLINLPK